jgi:hypothetical protein
LRPKAFSALFSKLVELLEQSAQSNPGELRFLLRDCADELRTAKAAGGACQIK